MSKMKTKNMVQTANVTLGDGNMNDEVKAPYGNDYLCGLELQTKNRYFP